MLSSRHVVLLALPVSLLATSAPAQSPKIGDPPEARDMRLVGFMSEADARQVADATIAEMQKLRPGFGIINDIRELKPTTQAASDQMRRAQEAAVKHGFSRAIRVVGDQVVDFGSLEALRQYFRLPPDPEWTTYKELAAAHKRVLEAMAA